MRAVLAGSGTVWKGPGGVGTCWAGWEGVDVLGG